MNGIINIDLLTVGIAMAANLLIGFAALFSNKKSATNILFFLQTLILSIWSTVNYISYQPHDLILTLYLVRLVLFFAVPNSVIFLVFMYTFPAVRINLSKITLFGLGIITLIMMAITLSPFVFENVILNPIGAPTPIPGIGILPFIIVSILSVPLGIYYLIKNYFAAKKEGRKQFIPILIGVVFMFFAIVVFNFIFPSFLHNSRYIPLSALFTLPFVAFSAYAIYRHKLFNVKNLITVVVAFAITVVSFVEIIFADSLALVILRVSVFLLVLIFSIRLVKDMFQLEFANDRLKELDELKTEFVSLATHQIRAPLTAIKGYISLIQEGDYGPVSNELEKAIDIIYQSTNNLVTIVGDFLDVSRIEQGKMKYEFSIFNIEKLLQDVVTEYRPNLQKKGLEITCKSIPGNYLIQGDKGKIKQVIGNIIDNSIKYTPKGHIDVSIHNHNNKILIEIADTGVGIPPSTMPKLFQKFSRADNANETNILGTGLGLYVAKEMIEAHHGRVWAESEGEDKGSQFYIELNMQNNLNTNISDKNPFEK